MISSYIQGLFLGFGAALPLGPINILIMSQALRDYKKAIAIGLGAMSADITYLLLILLGLTLYLHEEVFMKTLSIVGGVFLIYLSLQIYRGRDQKIHTTAIEKKSSLYTSYLKGYLLTLLNPYTILFWLSTTTYSTNTHSLSMTLWGMISAITLWVTLMPYFIHRKKHLISNEVASYIAIGSALILLFFGISLLLNSSIF